MVANLSDQERRLEGSKTKTLKLSLENYITAIQGSSSIFLHYAIIDSTCKHKAQITQCY